MIDDPTHNTGTYQDDWRWVIFCKVCSAEGEWLSEPCPGKFVANRDRKSVDKVTEHK